MECFLDMRGVFAQEERKEEPPGLPARRFFLIA